MTIAASIDCGTNTFRLLIADIARGGSFTPLRCERIITRLGEGFYRSGALSPAACQRSMEALHAFRTIIKTYPVTDVHAAATSVVREAANGEAFISSVMQQTGIRIRVLSGLEEARLTLVGVLASVPAPGWCLIVDIGGGSTELVLSCDGKALHTVSIRLGVVHLSERLVRNDPPAHEDLISLRSLISNACDETIGTGFLRSLDAVSPPPVLLVGTAGSITTLAAVDQNLAHYDSRKINSYRLYRERIVALCDRFTSMNRNERSRITGLERGREDLIIPGAAILLHIMCRFGFDSLTVSDGGLLEGILIDAHQTPHTP